MGVSTTGIHQGVFISGIDQRQGLSMLINSKSTLF
jgi:hypothetical protein